MYSLFLDDVRNVSEVKWVGLPPAEWVTVRSYEEFANYINNHGLPLRVSFDHDLADEHYNPNAANKDYKEKTGYDCAKFLVDYCLDKNLEMPEYYVHSFNPVGKAAISQFLDNFKNRDK